MWQHMFCVSVMRAVWRRELYSKYTTNNGKVNTNILIIS